MKIIFTALLWIAAFIYPTILRALPPALYECIYRSAGSPSFQYKIIQAPGNTWGYDILRDNKIFIHQPNRPGLPGNEGFRTKKGAIKVAQLVISKIKKGEMPPTISVEEMETLKLTK